MIIKIVEFLIKQFQQNLLFSCFTMFNLLSTLTEVVTEDKDITNSYFVIGGSLSINVLSLSNLINCSTFRLCISYFQFNSSMIAQYFCVSVLSLWNTTWKLGRIHCAVLIHRKVFKLFAIAFPVQENLFILYFNFWQFFLDAPTFS